MKNGNGLILSLIVPCYNEETVLPVMAGVFLKKIKMLIGSGKLSDSSRILFVNDGSKDNTWDIIKQLSLDDPHFIGISQSRNRGHQNAVLAGLMEALDYCDITITIDCDGQDDINAVDEMIDRYLDGFEVVYGVRSNRNSDTFLKRFTAESFYRILNVMGVEVVFNHADYRLISCKVLKEFSHFHEVNLFLRGMIPLVGFPSAKVYYERHVRAAGESHYTLSKMLGLAFDGITSLSIRPIRMITSIGVVVSLLSIIGVIWAFCAFFNGVAIAGWASTVCLICFFGGVNMLALGIIGEYVGKTYLEVKARPRYIISERTYDK